MNWLWAFLAFDFVVGILIAVWISRQTKSWNSSRQAEIDKLFDSMSTVRGTFSSSDVSRLPPPVQRYLTRSIRDGTACISRLHLKQSGNMRFNRRWIPIDADQYYTAEPPNFIWTAKMKLGPAWVAARDRYQNGRGNMLISVLSSLPLFNVRGPEMDHAALLRYLSELPWLPTAFLSDKIHWEEIDDRAVAASIVDHGVMASGVFHFNGADEIIEFTSPGRFRSDTGHITPWSGTFGNYQEFNGFRIPVEGSAVWKESGGDFEYIRLKIEKAEFNQGMQ